MPNTGEKVAYLYPNAIPTQDYEVYESPDGQGVIKKWITAKLGPQPTQAQLDAVTDAMVATRLLNALRTDAVAVFLTDKTVSAKVLRGVALVLLDQVNTLHTELQTLRDAVRLVAPTVPAVTYAQYTTADLKNAVQTKINNGAAD